MKKNKFTLKQFIIRYLKEKKQYSRVKHISEKNNLNTIYVERVIDDLNKYHMKNVNIECDNLRFVNNNDNQMSVYLEENDPRIKCFMSFCDQNGFIWASGNKISDFLMHYLTSCSTGKIVIDFQYGKGLWKGVKKKTFNCYDIDEFISHVNGMKKQLSNEIQKTFESYAKS